MEGTELAAIASRDLGRAQEFANRFQVKKAYGSYEEMVKNPEIDVVYIGTPHTEHKANAALCIMHDKAVLCEKPFTINEIEAQYLISLAKEHRVFIMEAMWTKFLPATAVVKQWLIDKLIGDIKYLNLSFGYHAEFDKESRLFNPNLGGGALLDVGVYPISYVIHMMERLPDRVISTAHLGKSKVDETNTIVFQYEEGILADMSSSISADTGNDAIIIGDKGKIVVPNFWSAESAEAYDNKGKLIDAFFLPFTSNGYVYEAEEVNRCIREGQKESDIIPLKDTLNIMRIMDDIRSSWGLTYLQGREE